MPTRTQIPGQCDAFSTDNCDEVASHTWNSFNVCQIHARRFNAMGATNYQPISRDNPTVPNPYPPLRDTTAQGCVGPVTDYTCSRCDTQIHYCYTHSAIGGCRQRNGEGIERCHLCRTCTRATGHQHCNGCNRVLEVGGEYDTWACINCGYGNCCVDSASGGECTTCRDNRESDEERDEDADGNRRSAYIHEYHSYTIPKARPTMRDGLHQGKPYLWLGVELECEMDRDHDRDDAARQIHEAFSGDVVMSYDGSLETGFETITGPFSLAEHEALWPKLSPTMAKVGCRSWKHHTTGLHIHASKNWYSQLQIGKMMVFLNSDKNRENIEKLAGRTSNHYAHISPKKLKDVNERMDRYEALNLTNEDTIEFRLFKGTLKTGHILADIEFVHALSMYMRDASIRVCEDWPMFWQYVLKNRNLYRNLVAFFALDLDKMEAA